MSTDEALKNVRIACEAHNGPWSTHQVLQQSLLLIEHAMKPKPIIQAVPDGDTAPAIPA